MKTYLSTFLWRTHSEGGNTKLGTLIEILNAVHVSRYVVSPHKQRGGLMICAPPASLKSSMLNFLEEYPSVMIASDLNVRTLNDLRHDLVASRITTMVFSDFEKLYQRQEVVSSNLEGHIKALVDEGFRRPSFQDQRALCMPAFCAVIGCMTEACYENKIKQWLDDGFSRRFIWVHYTLHDPDLILDAIDSGETLRLTGKVDFSPTIPSSRQIDGKLPPKDANEIAHMMRYHKQRETSTILLRKIVSVLKWKFPKDYMDILKDFAPALTPNGAKLTI